MTPNQTVIFCQSVPPSCHYDGMEPRHHANSLVCQQRRLPRQRHQKLWPNNKATLKSACERFCKPGGVDFQTRTKQNNTIMSICLAKLLMADAQARLLTYQNKYTFDGVKYTPLMYKIIMWLATIYSVATTQTLCNNLQSLGMYATMVSSDVDKVHSKFDNNNSQLIARGAPVDDPIGILFEAYLVVPCHHFKSYIHQQHENYLDGKLTTITHKALMTSVKRKFDWL